MKVLLLHATVRYAVAPLARLIYRPIIEGRHFVPRTGPVILASNHLSFIDSVVIPIVSPRPVAFLAKSEYFERRMSRALFTAISAIPVDRGSPHAAQDSLDAALEVLRAGHVFGIYPEGTRSRDGRIYKGRTGVAHLALTSGAPVVPVALQGTELLQPVGRKVPRLHRITVRFGQPMTFSEVPDNPNRARRVVTDQIMEAIGALSGQEEAGVFNDLPVI